MHDLIDYSLPLTLCQSKWLLGAIISSLSHFLQVGENGRAVGIDHIPELIKMAQDNIEKDSPELLSSSTVKLVGQLLSILLYIVS